MSYVSLQAMPRFWGNWENDHPLLGADRSQYTPTYYYSLGVQGTFFLRYLLLERWKSFKFLIHICLNKLFQFPLLTTCCRDLWVVSSTQPISLSLVLLECHARMWRLNNTFLFSAMPTPTTHLTFTWDICLSPTHTSTHIVLGGCKNFSDSSLCISSPI